MLHIHVRIKVIFIREKAPKANRDTTVLLCMESDALDESWNEATLCVHGTHTIDCTVLVEIKKNVLIPYPSS